MNNAIRYQTNNILGKALSECSIEGANLSAKPSTQLYFNPFS